MELEKDETEIIPKNEEEEVTEVQPHPEKAESEPEEQLSFEPEKNLSTEIEEIPEPEESVKLDDELAALIKSDLEKSKTKEQAQESGSGGEAMEANEVTDEEVQAKLEQFMPVEEKEQTEEIDLMKIGLGEATTDAKAKENPSEKPQESLPETKEEKKERKPIIIPWRNIGISAAAAVLLIAIGIGGYSLWYNLLMSHKQVKPTVIITEKKSYKVKEQTKEKPKPLVPDTSVVAKKADTAMPKLPNETKPANKDETGTAIAAYDLAKKKTTVKKKLPVKQVKQKEIKQKNVQKPVFASKEMKKEPVVPRTKTVEKPLIDKNMVYTVQVYTSPSRDDAEDWLRILKSKNIKDGFISTQKIRDKIWFRVRFGLFGTREEAQASAMKLGFDQVWIDRVR